jgi:hypothetical protein
MLKEKAPAPVANSLWLRAANSTAAYRRFICLDHILVQPGSEETAGIAYARGGQGTEATCRAVWKEDQSFHRVKDAIGIGWLLGAGPSRWSGPQSYSC